MLDSKRLEILVGDGWKGLPSCGPFDAIHVGAAAAELPLELSYQLKVFLVFIVIVKGDLLFNFSPEFFR